MKNLFTLRIILVLLTITGFLSIANAQGIKNCGSDKVLICHNNHTICISKSALEAHLRHGDELGGCTPTTSTTVETHQHAKLELFLVETVDVLCYGAATGAIDVAATGGKAPYSIKWSNGATTEDLTGLVAGNYSAVVTDAAGSTATLDVSITEPALLVATSTSTNFNGYNISCKDGSNGAIDISVAGGVAPYSFGWSTGSTTEDVAGLKAGTYTVVVADANGCKKTLAVLLTEPATHPSVSAIISPNTIGKGANPETIYIGYGPQSLGLSASAIGGIGNYSYSWSPASALNDATVSNPVASPLQTTTFEVVAKDLNGCAASASATVSVVDVRCGNKNDKILICHVPPGNNQNPQTICVSQSAVPAQLAIGAYLGTCNGDVKLNNIQFATTTLSASLQVSPNPSSTEFRVKFNVATSTPVTVTVRNSYGKIVFTDKRTVITGSYEQAIFLRGQEKGIYYLQVVTDKESAVQRLIYN